MSQIYTAFYDISGIAGSAAPNYVSHLYLVKDSDGNLATTADQQIIRGQAQNNDFFDILWDSISGSAGALEILSNSSSSVPDGLDYDAPPTDGVLDTDRNGDSNPDTYIDRGYTPVGLGGQDADAVWTSLVAYATRLDAAGYDYDLLSANCVSVAASALSSVGVDITRFFPNAVFVGENNLLDTNGTDNFTAFAGNGLYTLHDRSGTDTIKVENGARLQIVKDGDPNSGNTVVLQDFSASTLLIGVRYTLGVGSVPVYSDDLGIKNDGNTFLGSLGSAVLRVDDQYASGGLGTDVIEVRGESNLLIGKYNLAFVPKGDFGTAGIKFDRLFTSFTGAPDVNGSVTNDFLYGDSAANILTGGRGSDLLRGGTGVDTYKWALGDGSDTIHDTWETGEKIALGPGITRSMLSIDDSGSDLILVIGNGIAGYGGTITIKGAAALESTFLGDHVDNIIYESNPSTSTYLWGTYDPIEDEYEDLNDTVTGSDLVNDHIEGKNGNDTLYGLSGDDLIDGGFGSGDTLYGGEDNDRLTDADGGYLFGEGGHDTLIAGGSATLSGGAGNDIIYATGVGAYTITGGGDHDIISVSNFSATATINGGYGNDTLYLNNSSTVVVSTGDDVIFHDWGSSTTTLEFDSGWTWEDDITAVIQQNGRDLLVTHPDGTILLVDYVANTNSWVGKFGATGTPFNLSSKAFDFSYVVSENITFDGSNALNVALIETGSGNDTIRTSDTASTVMTGAGQDTIIGGDGDDSINAGADIDDIDGGAGNDEIYAGSGDDVVSGGAGNDILYGEDGDDTIDAGDGDNTVEGGDGNDTITAGTGESDIDGGAGNDTITSSATGVIHGGTGNDHIEALVSFTSDTLTVHGDDGDDFINASSANGSITVYGGDGHDEILSQLGANTVYGGAGDDTITLGTSSAGASGTTAYGNDGDDTIVVIGDDNTVDAGSGTNTVQITGTGNKIVFTGGITTVTLSGTTADTIVDFGSGESYGSLTFSYFSGNRDLLVTSTAGTLLLVNYAAAESLWKFAFGGAAAAPAIVNTVTDTGTESAYVLALPGTNDTITTGDFGDTINSYGGNDIIDAGSGSNTIDAGAGNDTITAINDSFDINTITGGDGDDTVYSGAGADILNGNADNDEIHGGSGNDSIDGGDGNDTLYGDGGVDTIFGGDGADTIQGGADNDTIYGDAGADILYGNDGVDTINGGTENDTIYGGDGNDTLRGDDSHDWLYGEAGNDTLVGGAGNDTLDGGSGMDVMIGGTGNDIYYVDNAFDLVVESANEGTDRIITALNNITLPDHVENLTLTGTSGRTATGNTLNNTLNGTIAADTLSGMDGNDTLNGNGGDDALSGGAGADNLYGGDGNDTLNGGDDNDYLQGGAGSNVLNGGAGNDTLFSGIGSYGAAEYDTMNGDDGNDTVYGAGADDIINGGAGNDTLNGGVGADVIHGDDGDDIINGGDDPIFLSVDDTLYGDDGNDTINGGSGNDTLYGGAGNDVLNGGQGEDTMVGGLGDDTYYADSITETITENADEGIDTVITSKNLFTLSANVENLTFTGTSGRYGIGNAIDNVITGTSGNDILYGEGGNDTLKGGNGNDTLDGGNGDDTLNMGLGTDTATGGSGEDVFAFESASLGSGVDTITDFSTTDDVIDLRNLLEGYDPMQHALDDFVTYTTASGNTTIAVDSAGTGSHTNLVTLSGVTLTGTVDDLVTGGQLVVQD